MKVMRQKVMPNYSNKRPIAWIIIRRRRFSIHEIDDYEPCDANYCSLVWFIRSILTFRKTRGLWIYMLINAIFCIIRRRKLSKNDIEEERLAKVTNATQSALIIRDNFDNVLKG